MPRTEDEWRAAIIVSVRASVPATLVELSRKYPGERLCGYALCTDDDLMTLFHVACTAERAAGFTDPTWPFQCNEWDQVGDDASFREPYELVRASYATVEAQGRPFAAHVETTFAGLVDALAQLRADGTFDPSVFLIVTSTDPGPLLERLANEAVTRLNPPALAASWCAL